MSRYAVCSEWSDDESFDAFLTQTASIRDKQNGTVYEHGAYRVVIEATGKPAKTGKGGTVPFYGETAWSDAACLARDLAFAARFAS